jgi:membrane protein implicated in regulation of membrane protease activity
LTEVTASREPRYAPLLSFARFGPGSIAILSLIALSTFILYTSGFVYFAAVSGAAGVLLFGAKSMEVIQLRLPEPRKLIGQRCVVAKEVGRTKRGLVRVYGRNGRLDPELWSAESEHEIAEGREAQVVGMQSIVLLIKPLE